LEPYVVAADVYAHPELVGMGGWSWYTGSAGWLYRVWLEEVFGFKLRGRTLSFEPVLPQSWPRIVLTYRFGSATYRFEIENLGKGAVSVVLDGRQSVGAEIELVDDGQDHVVSVQVGEEERLGRV
jgi:cellobiose phosphorylase